MNLARLNKILEMFWWAIAIISLVALIIFTIQDGIEKWSFYYIIPVIAALMALVRRFMKNRLEKSAAQKRK